MPSGDDFDKLTAALFNKDWDVFLTFFTFPLAVHSSEGLFVFKTPRDLIAVCTQYVDKIRSQNVHTLKSKVVAQEIPRNRRCRIWRNIYHDAGTDAPFRVSRAVMYCRALTQNACKIDMIEYTERAFPSVLQDYRTNVVHRVFA